MGKFLLDPSLFADSTRPISPMTFLPAFHFRLLAAPLLPLRPLVAKQEYSLTPANPTAFKTLLFSCAVNISYVFLSALPTVPDSGCRAGGPLDRAAAEEREAEDVGLAVGARLGGIAGSGL